jgi:hypothetical protein
MKTHEEREKLELLIQQLKNKTEATLQPWNNSHYKQNTRLAAPPWTEQSEHTAPQENDSRNWIRSFGPKIGSG